MKILSADKLENCFDGDFVYMFTLNKEWTKEAILALQEMGNLKYYESFPRPMFQLSCNDGTIVKGVQGTNQCRVIYLRDKQDKQQFVESFSDIIINF